MGAAERATRDDAEILALVAESWLRKLGERGYIPRALSWIDNDRHQFLVILNEVELDHRNNVQFLSWLLPKLRATAYCYMTQVRKVDLKNSVMHTQETVDIYASSNLKVVSIVLDVYRTRDGKIQYSQSSASSQAALTRPGLFHGRHRPGGTFSKAEEAEFDRIWGMLRERVHQF
jgi:hypothetical protein